MRIVISMGHLSILLFTKPSFSLLELLRIVIG